MTVVIVRKHPGVSNAYAQGAMEDACVIHIVEVAGWHAKTEIVRKRRMVSFVTVNRVLRDVTVMLILMNAYPHRAWMDIVSLALGVTFAKKISTNADRHHASTAIAMIK